MAVRIARHDPLAPFRRICRSCRAPILWAFTTASGERMPLDEKPSATGNVVVHISEEQPPRLMAGVLTRGQVDGARLDGKTLYRSHFVSCPDAARHRRSPNKTRRWRRS